MAKASTEVLCHWCGEPLRFTARGWVHAEGGMYVMRCPDCGWSGAPYPSPVRCPKCASSAVRDDHCALPQRS
jgi:ribosomal protein S27E